MDYVVEFLACLREIGGYGHGVRDDGFVVAGEGEVFCGEGVHDGVDFNDCCGDAVRYECRRGGAYSQSSASKALVTCGFENGERGTYTTKAVASESGTGSATSTSLTASNITNTP